MSRPADARTADYEQGPVPTPQRTSETSLLRRLEAAHARNQQLTRDVAELREQLAVAHADLREARRPGGTALHA